MTAGRAERERLRGEVLALIDRLAGGGRDDAARDRLLVELARHQAARVEPYRRLVAARGIDPDDSATHPSRPGDWPAVPADVFRHVRVAAHPAAEDVRVFATSGTVSGAGGGPRGRHPFRDLGLYDRAARAAAQAALFPDLREGRRPRLVSLVPSEAAAPDSSLAYMIGRFFEWFGDGRGTVAWRDGRGAGGGGPDAEALAAALDSAVAEEVPVALLGTSFAFAHVEETLGEFGERRWRLPAGSRLMTTGGFKGRAREVDPAELRRRLAERYGVPEARIVAEYGMTELSSQLYETSFAEPAEPGAPRRLRPPPWMRVEIVDPESLEPVAAGETGILRVEDSANLDSAWAIQTSDLARRVEPDGFELLGRAPGAVPRGCSLAVEEALGTAAGKPVGGGAGAWRS